MFKLIISLSVVAVLTSCATPMPAVKNDINRNVDNLHTKQDKPFDYYNSAPGHPMSTTPQKHP